MNVRRLIRLAVLALVVALSGGGCAIRGANEGAAEGSGKSLAAQTAQTAQTGENGTDAPATAPQRSFRAAPCCRRT